MDGSDERPRGQHAGSPAQAMASPEVVQMTTRGLPTAARIHQDCHKTGAEKAALLAELFKLPRYTSGPNAGKPMGMGKLEIKHKVASGYISRSGLLKNLTALKPLDTPFARAPDPRAGVGTKMTPETIALMERQASQWKYDFSDRDMAEYLREQGVDVSHVGI